MNITLFCKHQVLLTFLKIIKRATAGRADIRIKGNLSSSWAFPTSIHAKYHYSVNLAFTGPGNRVDWLPDLNDLSDKDIF